MSKTRNQKLEELYKLIWTLNPDMAMGAGMAAQFKGLIRELGDPRSKTNPFTDGLEERAQFIGFPGFNPEALDAMRDKEHNHYFKDVSGLKQIDVYRVLSLFGVTDPCLQHAIKKLLVAGGRGAGKTIEQDVREAIDSLNRCLQMIAENPVVEFKCEMPGRTTKGFLNTEAFLNWHNMNSVYGKSGKAAPGDRVRIEYYDTQGLMVDGPCEGYLFAYVVIPSTRTDGPFGICFGKCGPDGLCDTLAECHHFKTTQMNMKSAITEYEKKFGEVPPRLKIKCGLMKPE